VQRPSEARAPRAGPSGPIAINPPLVTWSLKQLSYYLLYLAAIACEGAPHRWLSQAQITVQGFAVDLLDDRLQVSYTANLEQLVYIQQVYSYVSIASQRLEMLYMNHLCLQQVYDKSIVLWLELYC
jgi:hypothetical protein